MPELMPIREPFLKPRQYVYFTEGWPEAFEKRFFEVKITQTLKRDIHGILSPAGKTDVKLDDTEGLLPTSPRTLYEMHVGLKGKVLLYPKWPSTDYFWKFEKPEFFPVPTDDKLRYVGFVDQHDTPFEDPRLREYTVKDMDVIYYELYCDSPEHEKYVARFSVNRCLIEPAPPEIVVKLERWEIPYRTIIHYKALKW